MLHQTLSSLWYGFGVAFEPHNLMWSFFGVLIGNLVGVLPGLGALTAMSVLLPLTFGMPPVAAIMMLAGIFYGAIYGGVIGAILLNLAVHPPHAVTCLDGYPLTQQGKGGTALGVAMIASFIANSFGILLMTFLSPLIVNVAYRLGPAEIFSIMLLGLLGGATMSGGSPLKGVAMTLCGLLCGTVGTDITSGVFRFTFGLSELQDGVDLVAIAMGLFGVAQFLQNVNRPMFVGRATKVRMRDMWPSKAELKQSLFPIARGTLVGTLFGAMPGTDPVISSFVSYGLERKISKTPERFGKGALEGVAGPEASAHSKVQVDFIPTMCVGIPGDPVMAMILGALMIQGIVPGPQLVTEHPDVFWGLIASFWVGNVLLIFLNVPLIGVWVKMLQVPYRYMFPAAMFFIATGVFSGQNSLFHVIEVLAFGVAGAILIALRFPLAPILLGFVVGPRMEENFRRALLISEGDMAVFIERPVSAWFVVASALLIIAQIVAYARKARGKSR